MARSVTESGPHPVDIHVGGRVRLRRALLGMNQGKLAEALGLAFQQVQKYERGANRISSSKLYHLSQILDVPVSFFFDDMPEDVAAAGEYGMSDASQDRHGAGTMTRQETLELVRAYYRIPDERLRSTVRSLIKAAGPKDAD